MRVYSLTVDEMTGLANQVKETVIETMKIDGHLTEEKANELLGKYVIVAYENNNVFGKMFAKLFGPTSDDSKLYYRVFKT